MAQDLRSFLDVVKRSRAADFQVVGKPVDARYEITGLVAKLEKEGRRRPVLLFENVSGTTFPVITNLHASRSRLAAAINAAPDQMLPTYLRAMDKPIAPRVVKTGPVKEVVRRGAEVDLLSLPQIVHHERDAGPYVTAAISFAKDPASETWTARVASPSVHSSGRRLRRARTALSTPCKLSCPVRPAFSRLGPIPRRLSSLKSSRSRNGLPPVA